MTMTMTMVAENMPELRRLLITAVQVRIKTKKSQSAAAREWQVSQSTINAIAMGHDCRSVNFLLDVLMRDGLVLKLELI